MMLIISLKRCGRFLMVLVLVLSAVLAVFPCLRANAEEQPKLIAFTFDDGPQTPTKELIDGLEQQNVVATFFMNGSNGGGGIEGKFTVENGLLQRMIEDGDQLANHTYAHKKFNSLSAGGVQSEKSRVDSLLFDAMGGSYLAMVRTPGGVYNDVVKNNIGAPVILWTIDTLDWKYRDADRVYNKIISDAADGSIVLMHDMYETSVQAALRAIETLKERGFEFVTVAELMRRKGLTPENGQKYTVVDQPTILPAYSAPVIETSIDKVTGAALVSMSAEPGVTLYYTIDGSYPNMADRLYRGMLRVKKEVSFTVVGYDSYGTRTPTATFTAAPVFLQVPRVVKMDDVSVSLLIWDRTDRPMA